MWRVRAGDLAEQHLIRQGKGWIHIPGQGHEALAALAAALEPRDLLFLYYRDRALMQARGVTPRQMASDYLATAHSSTGGKAMPVHGSYRSLGIFPPVTPTASQCLPAAGAAWGAKRRVSGQVVLCTVGDASTRQGEFFEAVCFAVQERLPIVFVVEDNGYGISTPTANQMPFRIGIFGPDVYRWVDGRKADDLAREGVEAVARARAGRGPTVLVVELDRLTSHTNSDDHRVYRSEDEILAMQQRDPIAYLERMVVRGGLCALAEIERLRGECTREVEEAYLAAERESPPRAESAALHLLGPVGARALPFALDDSTTMVAALNATLRHALARIPEVVVFGEDIEDPKGGVFGFTKGLSTQFPGRVHNSPLAEATIVGAAVGLAAAGCRPVIEIQFIDFAASAFNQLLNQVATLRWRSNGDWSCPLVIFAPYGAYLPAGSTWHSQSNEGFWTHIPGLRVAVPGTPADLAALTWTALHADDPTLILIPKHIMRARAAGSDAGTGEFGRARIVRAGSDVTVVTWGNGTELVAQVAAERATRCSIEIVDLVSLVPCDWAAIEKSVSKTGRLVVVSEDARTSSFGQAVITEMVGTQARFNAFLSPPVLVARKDCHIPFNPVLEYALLPDAAQVHAAITEVMR